MTPKFLFLLLFMCLLASLYAQEGELPGIVTYQNSGNKPVVGAEVSAPPWGRKQLTDNNGNFNLSIVGKKAGYQVSVEVLKPGYEVVNKKELRYTLKKDLRRKFKIYICPEGEWSRNAIKYYKINEEVITQKHRERLANLKEELRNNQRLLNDSLQRLDELYKLALSQAQRLAEQFAVANLDDADSLYVAAFEQFTQGNIDSAINILADDILDKNMAEAQEEKAEADTFLIQGQRKLENAEKARKIVAKEFWLRYKSKQKSGRSGASEDLQKAFQLDSTNLDIRLDYAHHLFPDSLSRRHYHYVLEREKDSLRQAKIWKRLSETFLQTEEEAKQYALEQALKLVNDQQNPMNAILYIQLFQIANGLIWKDVTQGDFDQAEDRIKALLAYPVPEPNTFEELLASIKGRLALTKRLQGNIKESDALYKEGMTLSDYSETYRKSCILDLEQLHEMGLHIPKYKSILKQLQKEH